MKKGSIFGNIDNYTNEIEKQLIKMGLDKKSIENNISKNDMISLKEANDLTAKMMNYCAYPLDSDTRDQAKFYEEMIRRGANLEYSHDLNGTILHFAIWGNKSKVWENVFSPVYLLLENGADYNAAVNGVSCLMESIKQKDYDVFNTLMLLGADVNYVGDDELTALHIAVAYNDTYVIEELLKAGVLIDAFACSARYKAYENPRIIKVTPLMRAVRKRNVKIVELLLQYGANVLLKDSEGNTVFDYETSNDMKDVLSRDYSSYKKSITKPSIPKRNLVEQAKYDLDKIMRK